VNAPVFAPGQRRPKASGNRRHKLNVDPVNARADAAKDVIGNGSGHAGDLLRVQAGLPFTPEQSHIVARRQGAGMAEIDRW
jgi:hypothetical protein